MLGRLFERPRPPQERGVLDPGCTLHVGDGHLSLGDRSGLVEHHGVDLSRSLECLVALEEDPEASTLARGDEQSRRRRQAQCTRTGDDQDRKGGAEGLLGEPPTSSQAARVTRAMTSTAGTKTAAMPVGEPLDGSLFVLGVLDQAHHVGQLGVAADLRRSHHQATPH